MRKLVLIALPLSLVAGGCNDYRDQVASPKEPRPSEASATSAATPEEPGVSPMTPTPLPNAPVSGSESVGGAGGGGGGQAAKDQARGVSGTSSLDQIGDN